MTNWKETARRIVEANLAVDDDTPEEAMADAIFDEAYTLAFDALSDAGCNHHEARKIAQEVAMEYAQP